MKNLLLILLAAVTLTSCTSRSERSAHSRVLEDQTKKSEQIAPNLHKLNQWTGLEGKPHVEAILKGVSDVYYIKYFTLKQYDYEDRTMVYLSSDGVYAVYNISAATLTLYRNVIEIKLK